MAVPNNIGGTELLTSPDTVVCGVLNKYVNITKGWRDRMFVLAKNKFVYYKLSGKHAVNVVSVLEHYDDSGNHTRLIGAKIHLLLKDHKKHSPTQHFTPASTYDLQSAKLRESTTEGSKFYVTCPGTAVCTVRTETPDDCLAWMSALTGQKLQNSAIVCNITSSDSREVLQVSTSQESVGGHAPPFVAAKKLIDDLKKKEGMADASCQRLIVALQRTLKEASGLVSEKNAQIARLMDERRELQTELVTESQRLQALPDELGSGQETSSSQNDEDDGDAVSVVGSASRGPTSMCDGDLFYDALEPRRSANIPDNATAAAAAPSESQGKEASPASAPDRPSWVDNEPIVERRQELPPPKETEKSVSLWSIIKECIGKDLTRICLPVYFNEPLSALQKIAEEIEYSELLDRAASYPKGSPQRLLYLSVFAITGYSGTKGRTAKPFNPLLGETFEYVDRERKIRFLSEKVIHHPTVLAARCEGAAWSLDADLEVKSKFWGRCIELKPVGRIEVKFSDGELMTWNKVTTTINNLIVGKIYVDYAGTMRVTSDAHDMEMRVKFKDSGSVFGTSKRLVSASMFQNGVERAGYRLNGVWSDYVNRETAHGIETLWKASPPAKDPTRYNLSTFAIQLNELTPGLEEKLPPTDCRLRPDQACLEQGLYDKANSEKQRLEHKQRKARKEAEEGKPIESRWFAAIPGAKRGEVKAYEYVGGYWEERKAGKFTGCRDIFGVDL